MSGQYAIIFNGMAQITDAGIDMSKDTDSSHGQNTRDQSNGEAPTLPIFETTNLSVSYGKTMAIKNVNMQIQRGKVVALIGPSGCGKSTLLRCFNRMNELIPNTTLRGKVLFNGTDIYARFQEPTEIRLNVGMVFQKPNPFPKNVYDNVAFGLRINGMTKHLNETVEQSLRGAALWDEVKDRLKENALSLSGGQQQRLCIARALAVNPQVILMDEPASSLDPISTQRIEDLIREMKSVVTIIIVTHNMQQASRISDDVAVMMVTQERIGELIEFGPNEQVFHAPRDERTEAYVTGRIG